MAKLKRFPNKHFAKNNVICLVQEASDRENFQ